MPPVLRRLASTLSVAPLAALTLALFACAQASDGTVLGVKDSGSGDDASVASEAGRPETRPSDGGGFDVADQDVGPPVLSGDPRTCSEAAEYKSYVGCDYWPTITSNVVWSIFDFAVVVANAGTDDADVTVDGPAGYHSQVTVAPGGLQKIYLPWVKELKGPEPGTGTFDNCPLVPKPAEQASVMVKNGAYHVVSTRPVTVYQFNALEYAPKGGPAGKDWSACPGYQYCTSQLGPAGCFSFSNDASLLLPSTAMTGNYRVTGVHSFESPSFGGVNGDFVTITATADGTLVDLKLGPKASVVKGGIFPALKPNDTFTFTFEHAGDVVQIFGPAIGTNDLSGTLVKADKPVQVIAGEPCLFNPVDHFACDHVEQSVFPAETLGKSYVVTVPTSPAGKPIGHIVLVYGNIDGTKLTYGGTRPSTAPSTIDAGQVIDLGMVTADFVLGGDQPFAVASFSLAGELVDPDTKKEERRGDPSLSSMVATEQYRSKYIFLAPDDYDVSYADVVVPTGASMMLDGAPLTAPATPIDTVWSVMRVKLDAGRGGAHVLTSTLPVGLQVMGYGKFTSYQYPGGLDLKRIAPPPPR